MKYKILLVLFFSIISTYSFATVWTITNNFNTFSPTSITINLGDTVIFQISGAHDAREVSQTTWNNNGNTALSDGFQVPFGGGMLLPEKLGVGTHYYVCTPHAAIGMKGVITVQNVTSIKESESISDISVFPNPASDFLTVEFNDNNGLFSLEIFDITGKKVLNQNLVSNAKIPVYNFRRGLYFIKISDKEKIVHADKLILK